ncbi:mediator of RNA polymerase II transcription subunit 15a [Phoenix dactylifera]|uniref:Mediator of RNA polymerase II transcription subunit 15a n=1 Tax=Phoenix dactylifera TaxID=42345 RepID=A0A8B7C127_PHODC|nr:mediator of RNA polymerase II transcription subunit 15a [Phoenix dactylifera]
MEANSWRLAQGEASADDSASVDWRTQLQHESRQRIVNKIMDTLKRCLPIVPGSLNELQKIAVRFEEKIYTAATSQTDYLRRISLRMLSMETKTQHTPPINPSMLNPAVPNQNPTEPVPLGNEGQSLMTPMVNLPTARQQLLPQNFQNNTSAAVQSSANLPSTLSSITGLSQSNISSVCQTSNLQNMPGISQNSANSSVGQGATPDIYANAQRQMQGRQQQQQINSQQQQQSQNQLNYQHQLQQQLRKQKLQHSSLMQPHLQQQSLLQPTQLQSSQQSVMQMSSGLQSGQSSTRQTQPTTMQSAAPPGLQQNQLNPVQQSVPPLLQQHPQLVSRQQAPPSRHQQTPSLQQQPTPVPQQSNLSLQQQQQQLMGKQTNISNMQQSQLLGQQNSVPDMQQQQQQQHQRLPVQQNSLLGMQQPQQMLNQQSISLHQQQQLGHESNISGVQQQQQQQQQQQLLGSLPNVSNMQVHQRSMHILPQPKTVTQPQQENQQTSLALLQPQGQQSQHQSTQQQIISQFQSQPAQLQQQLAMQQQPNSLERPMQQRLQASGGLLQSQNAIEKQKQFVQAQRVLPEVSSSTSVDSTAQTGHAGVADLQEEIYQKIKSMREMYFADLNELYQKIALKLQQHDAHIPPAKQSEQYEKMKSFKIMLERTLMILQISKNNIQPGLKEKLPLYEKQIVSFLASNKKKIVPSQPQGQQQFQHPGGLAYSSQVSQLQQHDNHPNQVQHMNLQGSATSMQPAAVTGMQHVSMPLPTHSGVPTTQQNIANALQPGSNSDSAQGSSFNSLQQGATGSMPQGGGGSGPSTINAPQQTNAKALSNSSMNTLQPNASLMQPSSNTLQQQHLKQQQQEQQQQLMQTQQMKQQFQQRHMQQQLLQQQQKQQLMQSQSSLQQQLHKQQKQQPAPMLAHQISQLHQTNEANESKVRPGLGIKPGLYQQHYSAGQRHGYYHQQLKPSASGASFPISSPQNLQVLSPQISHHSSPQADQHSLLPSQVKAGTPLQSASSPFVPSPSTPLAPSPLPADSEKQLSGISSLANAGHVGHQQSALAPPQALAVGTPGISSSSIPAESTSPDGNQANVPSIAPDKKSASEWPLERLIKVVKSSSPKALSSAISDIGSVVSMIDRIAGSAPGNGSRAAVGEDLVAMTKCRLQARNFMSQDGNAAAKKIKHNTSAMPLNNMSSAGSVNDSVKQTYGLDTSELESTATSRVKRQKIEVNHALLEEIREINQQLIVTIVNISEEDADSVAAASDGEGTVIKCSFTAVALSPTFKSQFASSHMSPILPLRLLVPANYPKCSPVLLDNLPDESSGESDDLSVKAKSRFSISLRGLSQPMSLGEMARRWDACARKVIAEYAQQTGGGSFSSRYGAWENCVA